MSLANIKPGDKITIRAGRYHGNVPDRVVTAARVVRNKIVDDAGKEWDVRGGRPWGTKDPWYAGERIEPHRPEHDVEIARLCAVGRARKAVDRIEWDKVSEADANALAALCERIAGLS